MLAFLPPLSGPADDGTVTAGAQAGSTGTRMADAWSGVSWFWRIAYIGVAIAATYHGYKRNDSTGWAIGWFIFGSFLPWLALPIALAQGFGKRA